jgi:hypothetical protein
MNLIRVALRISIAIALFIGLPLFSLGNRGSALAAQQCVSVGFTITHLNVATNMQQACGAKGGGAANLDPMQYVLNEYASGVGRGEFRRVLSAMSAQADSIRTIVWFRHSEDDTWKGKSDRLGLRVASGGKFAQRDIDALLTFVADARDARFSRITVVLSAQGAANPKCRKVEWGACYDSKLVPLTWSVMEQVISAVKTVARPGIKIVFDIGPTECFDDSDGALLRGNLSQQLRYLVGHYAERFHDRDFIVSCGSRNGERAAAGLQNLASLYEGLNVRPASLDIHVYEVQEAQVRKLLLDAEAIAAQLGVPLEVLESFYQHPDLADVIRQLRSSGHLQTLTTVQVFPRTPASSCQEDVQAPYSLSEFRERSALPQRCN